MHVSRTTSVREIIEADKRTLPVFEKHGVSVDLECPDAVLDFPIEDCESMCHIDDVDALVRELNELFAQLESVES